jgi:O-antigen/teichoic acid export membrane protein
VILYATTEWLISSVLDIPATNRTEALSGAHWLLALLPIALLSAVLQGALQGRLEFATTNFAQIFGTISGQVLPLSVASTGRVGLDYLIPGVVIARALTLLILCAQSVRRVPVFVTKPKVNFDHLRQLVRYGGWASVTTVLAPLLVTIDRLILATILGTKAVAFYTVPYDLAFKGTIFAGSVAGALTPRLASTDHVSAEELANRVTSLLAAAMTPLIVVAIFGAKPVLAAWLGPDVSRAGEGVAETILVGVWLHAVMTPHHSRLMAEDTPKKVALAYLAQVPPYFAALWIGVRALGVLGAAVAWSFRVLLDAVFILQIAGVLRMTIRSTRWLFPVIGVAAVLSQVTTDNVTRYANGLILLTWSFWASRREFKVVWEQVRGRRETH